METYEPLSEKEVLWRKVAEGVEKITDGLGMEIDPYIKDTVIALNVLGFITTGSCEGHLDRALPFPWIDVGTLLDEDKRYQYLKGVDNLNSTERREKEDKEHQAQDHNLKEQEQLQSLMDEFHAQIGEKVLEISPLGWNRGRIQAVDAPEGTVTEIRSRLNPQEIESLLEKTQHDMKKFTEFLKKIYFTA